MKRLELAIIYNNDNMDITVDIITSLSKFISFQFYTYYLFYFVSVNITFEINYLRERNFTFIIIKISERFGTLKEELNVTVLFILISLEIMLLWILLYDKGKESFYININMKFYLIEKIKYETGMYALGIYW